jgi:hypothetical protein
MIGFYGFNPSQNPLYSNLLGQGSQQPSYQNPLFSRLGGDNSFSRLQNTYSNVFNPEIIQAGMNSYNQGMGQFTPFDQGKFDADLKAKQEAEAAAKLASQPKPQPMSGLYVDSKGRVGDLAQLAQYTKDNRRRQTYNFQRNRLQGLYNSGETPDELTMRDLGIRPLGGK